MFIPNDSLPMQVNRIQHYPATTYFTITDQSTYPPNAYTLSA